GELVHSAPHATGIDITTQGVEVFQQRLASAEAVSADIRVEHHIGLALGVRQERSVRGAKKSWLTGIGPRGGDHLRSEIDERGHWSQSAGTRPESQKAHPA